MYTIVFYSSYFWIECNTPVGTTNGSSIESVKITFDGGTEGQNTTNFTYLENPEIDLVRPMKDIARYTYCGFIELKVFEFLSNPCKLMLLLLIYFAE